MSKKLKPLTPPDPNRCQAEKRDGSFMTLGPRSLSRCDRPPTVIAKEHRAGPDGRRGSMSLCDECKAVLLRTAGPGYVDFKPVGSQR